MIVQRQSLVVVFVHVVWAVAERAPVLPPSLDATLDALLRAHARDAGGRVLAAGCADDHVHALVRLPSTVTLATVVQYLKGKTAYVVNRRRLLPDPLHWQPGYAAHSIDPDALDAVTAYVLDQRSRHHSRTTLSRWEPPGDWPND